MAASSLTDVFAGFELPVPARVEFGGSQILRGQIEQGASPDLFVSAVEDHVQALQRMGEALSVHRWARARLVVIVPEGSSISSFSELSGQERWVLGTVGSPIGRYGRQVLERAGLLVRPVSEESNVRLVRSKVALSDAEAAFVYSTDIAIEGIRVLEIPEALSPSVVYSIARMSPTERSQRLLRFLLQRPRVELKQAGLELERTP